MTAQPFFLKDPDAVLDYCFDWAGQTNGTEDATGDWLASGETLATKTITSTPTGLTVDSSSLTDSNTSVTVWCSGGTAGITYTVSCKVTTSSSPVRTDERSITIRVQER